MGLQWDWDLAQNAAVLSTPYEVQRRMNQKQVMWIWNEVLYTWQSLRTNLFSSAGEHIQQRQLWSGNRRETHAVHDSDQSSAGQAAAAGEIHYWKRLNSSGWMKVCQSKCNLSGAFYVHERRSGEREEKMTHSSWLVSNCSGHAKCLMKSQDWTSNCSLTPSDLPPSDWPWVWDSALMTNWLLAAYWFWCDA